MTNNILILDDERDILESLKRKLERSGYTVVAVTNGFDGLSAARREHFDLVITDVVMPVMDGFHFFREFKQLPGCDDTPVIIVSAHASMEDTFRVFGIQGFFAKPIDGEKIIQAVQKIFNPTLDRQTGRSILILGNDMEVVGSMIHQLKDQGQKATAARDEADFLAQAFEVPPAIMLIDVLLPKLLAHELIKALRCFSQFRNTIILTYTHFSEKQLTSPDAVEQLKFSKNECDLAGATNYIGRFSRLTFMEILNKY